MAGAAHGHRDRCRNVFVVGLDERNRAILCAAPGLASCRFRALLNMPELYEVSRVSLHTLLDRAQRQLEAFDGPVDAVIGWWDFPVSSMVPILCRRLGLPSASLESVLKCEDKYWSRLEQRAVISEYPAFGIVALDTDDPGPPAGVGYPMWLKPVKSFSSKLAYKVHCRAEFDHAVREIRNGISRVGEPFDELLSFVDLPVEVAEVGGRACLAEQQAEGGQVTVEGYSVNGQVHVYGVIDSVNYPDTSSFLRYEYPSRLTEAVVRELTDVSVRVVRRLGLQPSTFNIEYLWDADSGTIMLVEINPRLSQSHAKLFEAVDGAPNLECMVRLALGEDPRLPHRQGKYAVAAKWFLRRFTDGVVTRVPTSAEIDDLQREIPGAQIVVLPAEGDRLSDLRWQDSYSYELADVILAARDRGELIAQYQRCEQALHFEFA